MCTYIVYIYIHIYIYSSLSLSLPFLHPLTPSLAPILPRYTHNLFYLAQAHGHVGDTKKSGLYCYMTLQRQLDTRFDSTASALDWVKNCLGISDFYIALGHYKRCALALMTAEVVLTRYVLEVRVCFSPSLPLILFLSLK